MNIIDVDGKYFVSDAGDILSLSKSEDMKSIIIKMKDTSQQDVTIRFETEKECDESYNMIVSEMNVQR
jgi:PDZ domain-containing secreted protein